MLELTDFSAEDYIETEEDAASISKPASTRRSRPATNGSSRRRSGTSCGPVGITKTARAAGLTWEGLHKALGESGDPKISTLIAVMRAAGVRFAPRAA